MKISQIPRPARDPRDSIGLTLPLPPALSALKNVVRGRLIDSKLYREWKEEAAILLFDAWPVRTPCEVRVTILPGKGWRRGCDIANREKSILDSLVENGIIPDDDWGHVPRIVLEFDSGAKSTGTSMVRVTVETLT